MQPVRHHSFIGFYFLKGFTIMKTKITNIAKTIFYSLKFTLQNDKAYFILKLISIIPNVLSGFFAVLLPKYIIDSLSVENSVEKAVIYTLLLIGTMIMTSLINGIIQKELSVRNVSLNYLMKKKLLATVANMDYDMLEDSQTLDDFEYAKVCLGEAGITAINDTLFSIISGFLSLSAYLYIIFQYSWAFLPLIIISVITNIISQSKKENMYIKVQEESAVLNRKIQYASQNLTDYSFAKEIRLFKLKEFILNKYNTYIRSMYGLEYRYLKRTIPLHILVSAVGALQIIIAYGTIGYSLYRGNITVGVFVQNTSAFTALSATISSIAGSFVNLNTKWVYISSYEAFLTKGKNNNIIPADIKLQKNFNCLELKNVSFRYSDSEEYVLRDLNLTIHANEKIAIVGENGAGKTTLIKLILGLYKPTQGEILLDGVPISSLIFEEYIGYFSAVFQDCSLVNYSVAENIALSERYSAEQIREILRQLHLEEKTESLKNGIDTYVTRALDGDGADMSGGEKQKLMIARALYKNAPVYIFDEPTSALSAISEYEIYKSFSQMTADKTVLYISHRLASCRLCSRIIVIGNGTIAEDGSFDELTNNNGHFAEMYAAQADYYNYEV